MAPRVRIQSVLPLVLLFLVVSVGPVPAQEKRPLDHDAYEYWNMLKEQDLSNNGAWAFWRFGPDEGDDTLQVRGLDSDAFYEIPRGALPSFSYENRHLAYLINPPHDSLRQARLDDVPQEEQPKDSLAVLTLDSGEVFRMERVRSFRLPEEAGGWIAVHLEKPLENEEERTEEEDEEEAEREDDATPGTPLVLRNLETGEEQRFEHASSYAFSNDGSLFLYTAITPEGDGDGIFAVDTATGDVTPLLTGHGTYPRLAIDEQSEQVTFLAHLHEDEEREDHAFTLYHWTAGDGEPRVLADETTEVFEEGWHVSENASLSFSDDGSRLFFGTAPEPIPEPDQDDKLDDEIVNVDIWHYQDGLLQPMQLEQAEQERRRTYQAVVHLNDDRVVQLGTEEIPSVQLGNQGDADVALGISDLPYQKEISWDWPSYYDAYLIDVESGEAELVLEGMQSYPQLSPEARYLAWWEREEAAWYALDTSTGEHVNLSETIPHVVYDKTNDRPFDANAEGFAGWTAGDEGFIVYDKYDLWLTDPAGAREALSLTNEQGRAQNVRLRYFNLTPDEPAIDPSEPLLLSAFDFATKDGGFFEGRADRSQNPVQLVLDAYRFSNPIKAKDADRLLFTRESLQEFGDLWTSNRDFSNKEPISDINPQQEEYLWGTVELMSWRHMEDGSQLDGLLYKPENFDPDEAYPMIVYFYERRSDSRHQHYIPYAHRSVIQPSFYTSRGYIVFVPDITYKEGYPGESAMQSIMPAVTQLMEEPWIDEERMALQGHSWAGYQISYMVTQTDMFRAAAPGAPVANMISAYGGIRWGSGMSRQFQYERTQSRIGGSLWEYPMRYIDNSPIFKAYKINTPLLIMHNDHDGAVPWEQGIELFTALRRLGKPAWLVNYNDEPHWPTTYANRVDWQIRLQQFLDHYLMDEPAPRWLEEGIPAVEKGTTLGLEAAEPVTSP